jgi:hypothetical protein
MKKPVLRVCVATGVFAIAALALASSVFAQNYVILYKQNAVASDAAATVKNAGGSVIATYPQIGVVIARSSSSSFGSAVLKDSRIDSAGPSIWPSFDQGPDRRFALRWTSLHLTNIVLRRKDVARSGDQGRRVRGTSWRVVVTGGSSCPRRGLTGIGAGTSTIKGDS